MYFQGDISQIEKEYQVLQEQLKEACENYEQRNIEGSEETKDLEEKLKRNIEENKVFLSESSCSATHIVLVQPQLSCSVGQRILSQRCRFHISL